MVEKQMQILPLRVRMTAALIVSHLRWGQSPSAGPRQEKGAGSGGESGGGWVGAEVSHSFCDETAERMSHPFFRGGERVENLTRLLVNVEFWTEWKPEKQLRILPLRVRMTAALVVIHLPSTTCGGANAQWPFRGRFIVVQRRRNQRRRFARCLRDQKDKRSLSLTGAASLACSPQPTW